MMRKVLPAMRRRPRTATTAAAWRPAAAARPRRALAAGRAFGAGHGRGEEGEEEGEEPEKDRGPLREDIKGALQRGLVAFGTALGLLTAFENDSLREWFFGRQAADLERQVEKRGRVMNLALVGLAPVAAADVYGGLLGSGALDSLRATVRHLTREDAGPPATSEARLLLQIYAGLAARAGAADARRLAAEDVPLLLTLAAATGGDGRAANRLCAVVAALLRNGASPGDLPAAARGPLVAAALASDVPDCRGAAEAALALAGTTEGAASLVRGGDAVRALGRRARGAVGPFRIEEQRVLCAAAAELRERLADGPAAGLALAGEARDELARVPGAPLGAVQGEALAQTLGLAPVVASYALLHGAVRTAGEYRAWVGRRVEARAMPTPRGFVFPPRATLAVGMTHMTIGALVGTAAWHRARETMRERNSDAAAGSPLSTNLLLASQFAMARAFTAGNVSSGALASVLVALLMRDGRGRLEALTGTRP